MRYGNTDFPTKVIILILIAKPFIDLFWGIGINVGGIWLSPLQVSAIAIFVYFFIYIIQAGVKAPFVALIGIFIGLHFFAFSLGSLHSEKLTITYIFNLMTRISISFLLYIAAYRIALRNKGFDFNRFFNAAFWGISIVVLLNVIAIFTGYGGAKGGIGDGISDSGGGVFREAGLYYDPGVLAIVGLNAFLFCGALLLGGNLRGTLKRVFVLFVLFLAIVLIFKSVSRAAMLLLAVDVLMFFVLFAHAKARVIGTLLLVSVLALGVMVSGLGTDFLLSRFNSEVAVFEDKVNSTSRSGDGVGRIALSSDDKVSLGGLEGLGSNRGMLWAASLTEILDRDITALLFGIGINTIGSHSDYIDVFGRNGFIGLIIYLFILFSMLLMSISHYLTMKRRADALGYFVVMILVVNYILYSFPFRPLLYTTPVWYMWIILGISFARASDKFGLTSEMNR
jgi:hypothetical protein